MPPDARDAALIRATASVLAGLIVATERADHTEIVAQVARLLNAVTDYNRTRERPDDVALRRAVARLGM